MQGLGIPKGWVVLCGISAGLTLIVSLFVITFLGGGWWKRGQGKIRLEDDEVGVGEGDA